MKVADVNASDNAAPIDDFKVEHVPQKYKFDITPHVHTITHWKPKFDGTITDLNLEAMGNHKTLKWSEMENMFRCDGEDRLLDKVIKEAETKERLMAESEKKRQELIANTNRTPKALKNKAMQRGSSSY
jgi:hypothetical protein